EVGLLALWLPILVSTVFILIASFLLHMVLPHHRTDFDRIEGEERFSAELQSHDLTQGQYVFPYFGSPVDEKDPEFQKRVAQGPVGILLIGPNEPRLTPKQLTTQFVYYFVLNTVVAYIAAQALPAGSDYLNVFQITGASSLIAYVGAHFSYPIWCHFRWRFAWKAAGDGLIKSLLTAGVFGWLWPM
ncbi:MAG: hypothetical protein R3178_04410, partial [Rhodothermales bacterium]|nr:hypothetical protein [Rhodothermales bacterium]